MFKSIRILLSCLATVVMLAMVNASVLAYDLEDRLMIEDVWARYVIALDSADAEAFTALFTEDAMLNVNNIEINEGKPAIKKMIESFKAMSKPPAGFAGRYFGPMRHIVTSLVVDIDGDTAKAESFWMEVMSNGKDTPPSIFNVGRYEDKLVKQKGKWYFSERVILADIGYVPSFSDMPAPPGIEVQKK